MDGRFTIAKLMRKKSKTCRYGCLFWCRKYFWEGQDLQHKEQEKIVDLVVERPWYDGFFVRNRRLTAFVLPALLFHICWWAVMIKRDLWFYFEDNFFISITMIFGSMIAGMTSVGGGAVAFPAMTLAFQVAPSVARDFSLMIQSCGMSAAAFAIFFMGIRIDKLSLITCTISGAVGCVFGLHLVSPYITPPQKKMAFVSIFFAFAVVLTFVNKSHKRQTFERIPRLTIARGIILIFAGFSGGIFTSFSGSGLDICCFSILTLVFRISEKVATPTSVVLMAGNSLVGFFWRGVIIDGISDDAWQYFIVCVPVVVLGAPIGSVLGSHFHRIVQAALVMILDTAALIGAFAIIRPLTKELIILSVSIIVGGTIFFASIFVLGQKYMKYDRPEDKDPKKPVEIDVRAMLNSEVMCSNL
ncbi:hypothetical protein CAPTEDRAFT_215676 [Capitella teleta]|uniref:Membrane transporter protein n=1 Tax=Capitella teleta TaxID=283909 RepID=R7TT16_CAPTE|nr:hypothetical protein CAPTEDRAFT_215676 [Capitella teleta]|eukprot:ELT97033.1 hypothetical protein CAPTEDRAFT_215676 [Capitella teleta]